jgi:hypothetical protein
VCARGDGIRRSKDLQAEIGKFPNSTNERKQMSTKTMKQRIALVAVSALTAGLFSVVSTPAANAVVALEDIVFSAKTDLINSSTCTITNTAGYGAKSVRAVNGTVVTLRRAVGTDATWISVSGPAVVEYARVAAGTTAGATVTATTISDGTAIAGAAGTGDEYGFRLTGLGTVTISYGSASTATPIDYFTITSLASCANNVYSPTYSNVSVNVDGADATIVTANVDAATSTTAGTPMYVRITAEDGYDAALTTGTYTANATNGAKVNWSAAKGTATTAGTLSSASTTDANGDLQLRVDPAQYATTSTTVVTITHNTTTVTTKSLTFHGEQAKIVVGTVYSGTTSSSNGAFLFTYQDTAGNTVPGNAAGFVAASAGTRITTATSVKAPTSSSAVHAATEDVIEAKISGVGGKTTAGVMTYTCGSSAGTADFSIATVSTVDANVIAGTVSGKCYGGIATYTVSTDKAAYKIGEIAVITIDAKDSAGNPASDSSKLQVSSVSVGGGTLTYTLLGTDAAGAVEGFQGGKVSLRAQMTTEGTFNTVVSLTGAVTSSATTGYSVSTSTTSVSNADVLKSIVALIASINKQIQALQKLILARR